MDRRSLLLGVAGTAFVAVSPAESRPLDAQDEFEGHFASLPLGDGTQMVVGLADVLEAYGVPGMSLAAIDGYRIVLSKGYGVTAKGSARQVVDSSLFQACSISKAVSALGALTLVADGHLALDANVNDSLKSWKVPENDFTKTEKVTLRRLLSHTAGLSQHGFDGYAQGGPVPTLFDVLDGKSPATNPPIRVVAAPGSEETYSGGGVCVEQLLMSDVTGQLFLDVMQARVLRPLGMRSSTFVQDLPEALRVRATHGTDADGMAIPGGWTINPELAAAGLWTTASDLARFAIAIADARRGAGHSLISQRLATDMLTPALQSMGLGVMVPPGDSGQFNHQGGDDGFTCMFRMNWKTGKGAVVMFNARQGQLLLGPVLQRVAQVYAWPDVTEFVDPMCAVVALKKGADAALTQFDYLQKTAPKSLYDGELNTAAMALLAANKPADAVRVLKRNVEAYPKSVAAWDLLAQASLAVGDNVGAAEACRSALAINPYDDRAQALQKAVAGA